MTCSRAQEWMQLYLDHRLSLARMRALERHIQRCKHCQADWMLLEDMVAGIHSLDHIVEPDGLSEAIMARIAAATAMPPLETAEWQKQRALRTVPFHLAARDIILSTILATVVVLSFVLIQPPLRNALGTWANPAIVASFSLFQSLLSPSMGLIPLWLIWAFCVFLGVGITLFAAGSEIRSLWRQRIREWLPQARR